MKRFCLLLILPILLLASPSVIAQQALTGFAQAPSASPQIYHTFDQADGTNANGLTLESGNSAFVNQGPGAAIIEGRELTNGPVGCTPAPSCSNVYLDFANTSTLGGTPVPIVDVSVSFRFIAQNGSCPVSLIVDNATGSGAFVNFLHLNVCNNQAVLSNCYTGSCPSTFNVMLIHQYTPVIPWATYKASMHIDEVNHTVTVTFPDGYVSPAIAFNSSIVPLYNRVQLGGETSPNVARLIAVTAGFSKADALVAAGGAAPMAEVSRLNQQHNMIVGQKSGLALGDTTAFATFVTPGAQAVDRLVVRATTTVESGALPGVTDDNEDWLVPVFSTACCNTLGTVVNTLQNVNNGASDICMYAPVTAAITAGSPGNPYTVTLYVTPNTYGGCPDNSLATGARFNYSVEALGDPNGILNPQ